MADLEVREIKSLDVKIQQSKNDLFYKKKRNFWHFVSYLFHLIPLAYSINEPIWLPDVAFTYVCATYEVMTFRIKKKKINPPFLRYLAFIFEVIPR